MLARESRSSRTSQAGGAVVEFALVAPLVCTVLLGAIDMGRLVRLSQVSADVSRAAAAVGAHGFDLPQALDVARTAKAALDLDQIGIIFITLVTRKDVDDPTPWVVSQVSGGDLAGFKSRLGAPGGPAKLNGIQSLEPGMRLTAVEVAIPFEPMFPMGDAVYPATVYDVAYF